MLSELIDALSRPSAYRRFAAEPAAQTIRFIAFLSILYAGALGIEIKLRLQPIFDQTFQWLADSMPRLTFKDGGVVADPPGPLRLSPPRSGNFVLVVDTTRPADPPVAELRTSKTTAMLTARSLIVDTGAAEAEKIDFGSSRGERPFTVDRDSYAELAHSFRWFLYPAAVFAAFMLFALWLAVFSSFYGVAAVALSATTGRRLTPGEAFRVAVHAHAAGGLLFSLDALLPFAIPFTLPAALAVGAIYLWLGVRDVARAAMPTP